MFVEMAALLREQVATSALCISIIIILPLCFVYFCVLSVYLCIVVVLCIFLLCSIYLYNSCYALYISVQYLLYSILSDY